MASMAPGAELVLADNGHSAYQIVVAGDASPSTKHGAGELQKFLEEMTGVKLAVVSDQQPIGPREIILGDNAHFKLLGTNVDVASLGPEGYVVRTVGEHLLIAGGQLRGNLYGVYGFLEDHLGCRWFAPGVSRVPRTARLAIGEIDDRQVPVFEYREPFICECFDADWCVQNRMNSSGEHGYATLGETVGGRVQFGRGLFCHTFYQLVPPQKYFDQHPEYFALVDGKRQKEDSQLCCSNRDVARICTERILEAMRAEPNATIFSVSQNDGGQSPCQCPRCQNLALREDSQAAPLLLLVNRVAQAVEKEFPDKIVETLAYEWGRHPPKHMRPRSNVLIRLCSGGQCCFSHPFDACDSEPNRVFSRDLEGWSKIAPRLWVWDYVANFNRYLLPHPTLRVLAPNIRLFAAHHVKGVFAEGVSLTFEGEFAALKGYIIAKLLWNPNCDVDRVLNDFLTGYYGKAAEPIRAYIDMLHDNVERNNIHVTNVAECDSPHLADDLLVKADKLWQRAEDSVVGEPDMLRRVKLSRMSVDYAILERARLQARQSDAAFRSLVVARFKPFFEVLLDSRVTHLGMSTPLDKLAYRRELADALKLERD